MRVAAKVDPTDEDYFEEQIAPLFEAHDVDFVGELGEDDKPAFYAGAAATLFPSDWPEPFGLVMIESLAAGTPVIALRRGSVPEVLVDGRCGFICDDAEAMIAAVARLDEIDPSSCRRRAADFSVDNDVRPLPACVRDAARPTATDRRTLLLRRRPMNSSPITTPSRTGNRLPAGTGVPLPLSGPTPFARAGLSSSTHSEESIGRTLGNVAHRHPAVIAIARLGWVAKGIVYGLVGVLAVPIAIEGLRADRARDGDQEASPLGAVAEIAETSLGAIALWDRRRRVGAVCLVAADLDRAAR